jgi:hypothetical protein
MQRSQVQACCKLEAENMVALLHCGEDGFPDDVIGQLTRRISKARQDTQHEDYIRPNVLIPKAALGSNGLSFR